MVANFVRNRPVEPRVSVVVPTLNEARNLSWVFKLMPDVHEVILVDGRSVDDTIAVAQSLRPDIHVVLQTRRGKGNALACGFEAVTGDVVVMLDADGSADPREIPRFVRALVEGADFAKGTRFAVGGGSNDITRIRRLGNKGLNGLVNVLYKTQYTDLCYGYNAFWTDLLPVINLDAGTKSNQMLWGDGFEVETLINVRIAKAGMKIEEVPSFESDRIHGVSNLNAVSDGLRVLRTIATERRIRESRLRRIRYLRGTLEPSVASAEIDDRVTILLPDVPTQVSSLEAHRIATAQQHGGQPPDASPADDVVNG